MKKVMAGAMALTMMAGTLFSSIGASASSIVEGGGADPNAAEANLTIHKYKEDGTEPLEDVQFHAVRIMDLIPGETPGEFASYKVNPDFASALNGVKADELGNYSAKELESLIEDLMELYHGLDINDYANGFRITTDDTGTASTKADRKLKDQVPLGYYLVIESEVPDGYTALKPFLVAIPSPNNYQDDGIADEWVYDVEIDAKNVKTSLDKWIVDGDDRVKTDTVSVGDTVNFEVDVVVPSWQIPSSGDYSLIYRIADSMSLGLKYNKDLKVYADYDKDTKTGTEVDAGVGYGYRETQTGGLVGTPTTYASNDRGYQIEFLKDWLKDNMGKKLTLVYTAEVTEDAIVGPSDERGEQNINTVKSTYNPDPTITDEFKTLDDETRVFTFSINIDKFMKGTASQGGYVGLGGAEFALYSDAACTTPNLIRDKITTDKYGMAAFEKLAAGIYYLKETKAPEGFKLLSNPIKIEIIADRDAYTNELTGGFVLKVNDKEVEHTSGKYVATINQETDLRTGSFGTEYDATNGISTIAVENKKGFTLPETGGAGIAIFLVIGIVGMIALSIAMMKKKKA